MTLQIVNGTLTRELLCVVKTYFTNCRILGKIFSVDLVTVVVSSYLCNKMSDKKIDW